MSQDDFWSKEVEKFIRQFDNQHPYSDFHIHSSDSSDMPGTWLTLDLSNLEEDYEVHHVFENVSEEIVDWLECIIDEIGYNTIKKWWQSKCNKYIIYDYAPFLIEGFNVNIDVCASKSNIEFMKYLYNKRLEDIAHLENCAHI